MKKILSILLVGIIMCGGFSVPSGAAASYKATWGLSAKYESKTYDSNDTIIVAPGSTVNVTVSLSNNYYTGSTTVHVFYSTAVFSSASKATFNKSGKLYSTCGASMCTAVDWPNLVDKDQYWPAFTGSKLTQYKASHHYMRIVMATNVGVSTQAAKSINENLITIPFKVSSTAKNGTTGQIEIPIEAQRTSNNKFGPMFCAMYPTANMVGSKPTAYSDSMTTDCSKAVLNFKVSTDAVILSNNSISMNYKDSQTVTAQVNKGSVKTINWKSSNTSVATVDKSGKVTATGKGTATITATTTDGKYSAKCDVTVNYSFWQIIIIYVLFGFIWYK